MKVHTYQLTVELQVDSTDEDARSVEATYHTLLNALHLGGVGCSATLSAIKCAKVYQFDEAHWGRQRDGSVSPAVEAAIDFIALLIKSDLARAFGEFDAFDAPAEVLVKSRWPKVTDWECGDVTYSEGVVTLHDLYVVE